MAINLPIIGRFGWGAILNQALTQLDTRVSTASEQAQQVKDQVDADLVNKIDKVETRISPKNPRQIELDYALLATQPNLSEVKINGIVRSWFNEAGFFRGRQHYVDYADALVRGVIEEGDFTGLTNGGGNWIELVTRLVPDGPARKLWGVRWSNGKVVRNGVEVPDLWMRGSASSALQSEMPAGTVLVTVDGEKTGPRNTIGSWDGGTLPTVAGSVTSDATVGLPSAPSLKIGSNASAAYARFDFSAKTQVAVRSYFKTPSAWPSAASMMTALRPTNATIAVGTSITGTASPGRLRLTITGGVIIAESPAILNTATNYRLEMRYDSTRKWAAVALYSMGENVPIWNSGPIANPSLNLTITRVDIGRVNNSPAVNEFWVDNIQIVDGAGAPVGRHSSDTLSATPLPTPPYAGPVGFWDGTTLLPTMNHQTPASDVSLAPISGLTSGDVQAVIAELKSLVGTGGGGGDPDPILPLGYDGSGMFYTFTYEYAPTFDPDNNVYDYLFERDTSFEASIPNGALLVVVYPYAEGFPADTFPTPSLAYFGKTDSIEGSPELALLFEWYDGELLLAGKVSNPESKVHTHESYSDHLDNALLSLTAQGRFVSFYGHAEYSPTEGSTGSEMYGVTSNAIEGLPLIFNLRLDGNVQETFEPNYCATATAYVVYEHDVSGDPLKSAPLPVNIAYSANYEDSEGPVQYLGLYLKPLFELPSVVDYTPIEIRFNASYSRRIPMIIG